MHNAEVVAPGRFDGGSVEALRQGIARLLHVPRHLENPDARNIVSLEGSTKTLQCIEAIMIVGGSGLLFLATGMARLLSTNPRLHKTSRRQKRPNRFDASLTSPGTSVSAFVPYSLQ